MSHNQPSDFDNLISGAENMFGGSKTSSTAHPSSTSSSGLINSAQNLLGGQSQPQNQYSQINNTIDTAQGMMGHTGQGGPGYQGYIDQAQSLTGHKGPAGGVQGALNTAQGMQNLQKISGEAQKSGLGNLVNTAEGYLGQGQTGKTQQGGVSGLINQAEGLVGAGGKTPTQQGSSGFGNIGGINSSIDSAQAMMGHTGQGGPGIQGSIDTAQGYLGQAEQMLGQGKTGQAGNIANTATKDITKTANAATKNVANTANTATRNATNTANTAARGAEKKHHGLHGLFDKAKGLFGHHHHTDTA